jgi:D-alanyl-lipoteichoic acid acyltransferase DltB (MBOAT superfamily)
LLILLKDCNFTEKLSHILSAYSFLKLPSYYNKLLLPIGISYYSFQALSYLIDVYIRKIEPEQNFGLFALYLSFFPKFLQGPIERAKDFIRQFHQKHHFNYDYFITGSKLILYGLFKKVVIADRLLPYVEKIYSDVYSYSGLTFVVAATLFIIQMYADFSGYTDMALGSARLFGINLTDNFNCPYFAKNIQDLYRRWHITLCSWIKDYIFIPLHFTLRKTGEIFSVSIALFSSFLIFGLWHGAKLTFVVYGLVQGICMGLSLLTQRRRDSFWEKHKINTSIKNCCERIIVISFLIFSSIFFRAKSLSDSLYIFKNLLDFSNPLFPYRPYSTLLLNAALVLSFFILEYFIRCGKIRNAPVLLRDIIYIYIIFAIILYGRSESEFIYIAF